MIHPNCNHVCSGNCRRVGCSCLCGEWHDKYEDDRQDNRSEWDGKKYFEHEGEVFEDDRQRLHIEVIFNTHHNPGSLLHLREIAKAYLAPKGIELRDDLTIEI